MFDFLYRQNVSNRLIDEIKKFRDFYKLDDKLLYRVPKANYFYYGKEVWEMAIAALIEGENIILSGEKATGKNVLADNLAMIFNRPSWNISFNINTDSSFLIGSDSFENDKVFFRKGPICEAAVNGGFAVLDEINMAKNDAISVLYSALDYRKIIDIPGYEKIILNEATRFIGTMNYGYAGTKELNEALVSRFFVLNMPSLTLDRAKEILKLNINDLKEEYLDSFAKLFLDLQLKSTNAEISSKCIDLRGLISSIKTMKRGLNPRLAIRMGITNKAFDVFEREIIEDVINLYIPNNVLVEEIFTV